MALLLLSAVLLVPGLAGCASTGNAPTAVRTGDYAFWPPFPNEPKVQFLVAYTSSADVTAAQSSKLEDLIYGKDVAGDVDVTKPYGVDMWNGRIYVCDIRGAAVMVFDIRSRETRLMGTTGVNSLVRPSDIAIADDGMKYVTDLGRNVIFVFNADERFVTMFGHQNFVPSGIAVHGDRLYVGDFETQRVEIMNRYTGEVLGHIGERGDNEGQFLRPLGVDVDAEGNVWVSDVLSCRVQKFSPDGEFIERFGEVTNQLGGFVRPKHLSVDKNGQVYVTDSAFQNVQVFSPDAKLLTFFGVAGVHPGAMYLPVGVEIHEGDIELFRQYIHPLFEVERLVLVTNQLGPNKVAVYGIGNLAEGHSANELVGQIASVPLGVTSDGTPIPNPNQGVVGPGSSGPSPAPADDDGAGQGGV